MAYSKACAEDRKRFLVCLPAPKVGDFLLLTPLLAALRARFPDAYIALLLRLPDPGEWITCHPLVDHVIWCRASGRHSWRGLWKLAREIRQQRFDAALYRGCSASHVWAMWLAGIPVRIAGPYSYFKFLLTHPAGSTRRQADRHEVEYNLDLLQPLAVSTPDPRVHFTSSQADQTEANRLMQEAGVSGEELLIALNTSHGGSSRLWPAERFGEAAERLARQTGARILLIGQDASTPLAGREGPVDRAVYTDLRGRTTLGQLAAILPRCRLHISVDTGTAHLAAAMNTPCVTIFPDGRAWDEHRRWRPWQTEQRLLGPSRRCQGCEKRCHRKGSDCLESITAEQIAAAACELLAQAASADPSKTKAR